jgi:acetyl-CoA carboxylase carboxyl transferase subunit alpha
MSIKFLDFEQPIAELEAKIEELRLMDHDTEINIQDELAKLEIKSNELIKSVFGSLTEWQITQLARHPLRPHTLDYVEKIFTDFQELQGDRHCSNAAAIVGGIARLDNEAVMVIGHQKGRSAKENVMRNFGMPKPEGYRKALRLMEMAQKFRMPVFTFIDTSGAYPGIDAEERNQSEAIARNLFCMSSLNVPIICTVIGEGGSGGALAIGVGDWIMMLQYSIYSVITPEGCASILWKSADKAKDAAEALGVSASRLKKHGLVDQVLMEPLGGAHRDVNSMASTLKAALCAKLDELKKMPPSLLLENRYRKLVTIGTISAK